MQEKIVDPFQNRFTRYPILVPADPGDIDDGPAGFLLPSQAEPLETPRVHIVRKQDLKGEWLERNVSRQDCEYVVAASNLRAACRDGDRKKAREAYNVLGPLLQGAGIITDTGEYEMADFYSATPAWFPIHYQRLMTRALADVRLVLWWPSPSYSTLAFYCPSWRAALMLSSVLERFRMCPCGELFIPRTAGKFFCCSEHGSYYRLRQWRERKKAEIKKVRRRSS